MRGINPWTTGWARCTGGAAAVASLALGAGLLVNTSAWAGDCGCTCFADLDGDGTVGGADLGLLLGAWETNDPCADLSGDGTVDGADLGLLLGSWDTCSPVVPTECGDPCAGPCDVAHDTPFCDDAACCQTVCAADSFCCEVEWDGQCVSEAAQLCGGGVCPNPEHDCCTTGTPGCSDADCCNLVCAADPFCCDVAWDSLCVDGAEALCGLDCTGPLPCPNPDHDCFTTGTPGCSDQDCCETVCAADPFCCEVSWDGICVNEAGIFCAEPCIFECVGTDEGEPCGEDLNGGCNVAVIGDSDCCIANGGLGCDDDACEAAVCGVDPFCCETAWDGICAGEALTFCPELCQVAGEQYGSIDCGETVCGTAWADNNFRDTDWYTLDLSGNATDVEVTATLFAEFGGAALFFVNDDCGAIAVLATGAGNCPTVVTACLQPGVYRVFVAQGVFAGAPCDGGAINYQLTVECGAECVAPACGVPGTGSCFEADGTPFCDDEECCEAVCAIDPFCCQVAWDGICVDEANIFCADPCVVDCSGTPEGEDCGDDTNGGCNVAVIGDSDCCIANGGLGCDDDACEAAVCGVDPFCCETAWDGICAGEALTFCPELCQVAGEQYGSIDCGETVCGTAWADNNLRDTDWYTLDLSGNATDVEVTAELFAEFPGAALFFVNDDCGAIAVLATGAGNCPTTVSACLAPGVYRVFVAQGVFAGQPCDGGLINYQLTVTCGAECVAPACGAPGTGDCFEADGTPFCEDAACCGLVCSLDPFCCQVAWDSICVDEALQFCNAEPIVNDACADAVTVTDGDTEFSTIGATTDGPELPAECDEGFGLAFVNDVWYTYVATCTGTVSVSTCNTAGFDTRLAAYEGGCPVDSGTQVGCNDDDAGCGGFTSILNFPATAGQTYTIRLGGFASSGTGTFNISCN